jgi:hypothetical protein
VTRIAPTPRRGYSSWTNNSFASALRHNSSMQPCDWSNFDPIESKASSVSRSIWSDGKPGTDGTFSGSRILIGYTIPAASSLRDVAGANSHQGEFRCNTSLRRKRGQPEASDFYAALRIDPVRNQKRKLRRSGCPLLRPEKEWLQENGWLVPKE